MFTYDDLDNRATAADRKVRDHGEVLERINDASRAMRAIETAMRAAGRTEDARNAVAVSERLTTLRVVEQTLLVAAQAQQGDAADAVLRAERADPDEDPEARFDDRGILIVCPIPAGTVAL